MSTPILAGYTELPADTPVLYDLPLDVDLQPWVESIVPDLRAAYPQVQAADLRGGLLAEAVAGVPAGTPLVALSTPQGPQLLAFPVADESPAEPLAAPAMASLDQEGIEDPEASGLLGVPLLGSLAEQLGTMLGKALLKEVSPDLYYTFFDRTTDEIVAEHLKELKNELKGFLLEMKQEAFEDEFLKARGWLRDTYSEKMHSLATHQYVDAKIVLKELAEYQRRMQELAEVLERRITTEELAACTYPARLKVELHRLAYLQRLVLMAARILWYRIQYGKADDSLENEFRSYADKRLQANERMVELLRNGRYGKIGGPYHLNYGQFKEDCKRHTGHEGYGLIHCNYYNWYDDFESSNGKDPFHGGKRYQIFHYSVVSDFDGTWLIPGIKRNTKVQDNTRDEAQRDRDKHYQDVKRVFDEHVENPTREANRSVQEALQALDKLQREGIEPVKA